MEAKDYKKELDFIKTQYPNVDETDSHGMINGNFWIGIAKLIRSYSESLSKATPIQENDFEIEETETELRIKHKDCPFESIISKSGDKPTLGKVTATWKYIEFLRSLSKAPIQAESVTPICEEIWDEHSEYLDTDIDSLQGQVGTNWMSRTQFMEASKQLLSQLKPTEKCSHNPEELKYGDTVRERCRKCHEWL